MDCSWEDSRFCKILVLLIKIKNKRGLIDFLFFTLKIPSSASNTASEPPSTHYEHDYDDNNGGDFMEGEEQVVLPVERHEGSPQAFMSSSSSPLPSPFALKGIARSTPLKIQTPPSILKKKFVQRKSSSGSSLLSLTPFQTVQIQKQGKSSLDVGPSGSSQREKAPETSSSSSFSSSSPQVRFSELVGSRRQVAMSPMLPSLQDRSILQLDPQVCAHISLLFSQRKANFLFVYVAIMILDKPSLPRSSRNFVSENSFFPAICLKLLPSICTLKQRFLWKALTGIKLYQLSLGSLSQCLGTKEDSGRC
jgi:hypothetical protein